MPNPIITTSWDDGHPLDERLAELLNHHSIASTMYVPTTCDRAVMNSVTLRRVAGLGVEIGGHTTSHRLLTKISLAESLTEMRDNRLHLDETLGTSVSSFCYPGGYFSKSLMRKAKEAGFSRARTTMGLRYDRGDNSFALPVTVQLFPHGRCVHLRHALKEGNFTGLAMWAATSYPRTVHDILERCLARIARDGGILHLWRHSWELDECGLWPLLDEVLALISNRPGFRYLTNAQAYDD